MKEVQLPPSAKLMAELIQAIANQFPYDKLSMKLIEAWMENKEALLLDRLRDALCPMGGGSSAISYIRHNERLGSTSQRKLTSFFAAVLGALPSDMTDQVMSNWISSEGALREALEGALIPSHEDLLWDALFSDRRLIKVGDYISKELTKNTRRVRNKPQGGYGKLKIEYSEGSRVTLIDIGKSIPIPETKLEVFQPREKIDGTDFCRVAFSQLESRPIMSLDQLIEMIRQYKRGEATPLLTSGDRRNLATVRFEKELRTHFVSLICLSPDFWHMDILEYEYDFPEYFSTWDRYFEVCNPVGFCWNPIG